MITSQNRLLLFVEMELISVAFAALLASVVKHLHTTPSDFPFDGVFGAMSGYSAIVLSISFAAAVEDRPLLLPSCRWLFHSSYLAATAYGALVLVLRGPPVAGKSHHVSFT